MPAATAEAGTDYAARFSQLDAWLHQHQALWRAKPFTTPQLPWEADWPELATWLRGRTLEQAEAAHNQPQLLDAPEPFASLARRSIELTELPQWHDADSFSVPGRPLGLSSACSTTSKSHVVELLSRHIPGRKWQQITRFAACVRLGWQEPTQHWLDWCAGKGHLGRLLAWQGGQPLTCLERDAALNRQGAELGRQLGVASQHLDADVLEAYAWQQLQPEHSIVALHACGQLHMTLLQQAVAQGCAQLAVSPCCYNRIDSAEYRPLSSIARAGQLRLTRDDLGLPLQESITAGQRVRRLRDQSMAWRLAFDIWQRQARGIDRYLPTPSRPQSALGQGIAHFCRDLAAHHQLQLREPDSWEQLEEQGWQRLAQVRNLELLPGLFRRPLEVWLLLDRALYLEQMGYQVRLGQFCEYQLTPRNLLLVAERCSAQTAPTL
ncbi:methyltransferase [Pseudomonas sp. MYb185]|uniref:methyltransferase n=1 Tax=Pseudomonas sp. MYb185 TaxID=1848729 RepID=UPI000CFA81BE|nr:methyltransferase [Pseudomonas sp. MYb185]PRB80938.1 SAM-dependent methyltransferase [Pseudomonas sp. MYb185]